MWATREQRRKMSSPSKSGVCAPIKWGEPPSGSTRGAPERPDTYTWTSEIAELHGMEPLAATAAMSASIGPDPVVEKTEDPNGWGKYAGGKLSGKKTGYQNFVSKQFAGVRGVLAENLCVEKEEIGAGDVWRELSLGWKELSEEQREHWTAFAKGKAAMPVHRLSDWRTPHASPPTTHQIDKQVWARVEYLAKHNLQEILDDAINAAIDAQSPDPKIFIANFLDFGRLPY